MAFVNCEANKNQAYTAEGDTVMITQNRSPLGLLRALALLLACAMVATACSSSDGGDAETESDDSEESSDSSETEESADGDADESADGDAEVADAGDRIEIRWFIGLGTGSQDEQIDAQDAVVAAFNESQDEILLVPEYVDNETASDVLATQIAAGNPPDIIGPVGLEGSNAFAGQYADLDPLIETAGFDLSPYNGSEEGYRNADGGLEGIPFATFPTALFYNTELFDEAGLPYPPAAYEADGTSIYGEGTEFEGEWDWDKLAEIAAILSVDASGVDASSPDYDQENIVQFGFAHQWTTNPTSLGTSFGAGRIEQADGSPQIPAEWVDSWTWYHELVHVTGAAPNDAQTNSDLLAGNVFNSGNVAMASTHLWYTCCLADEDGNPREFWDLAALPTRDGVLTSKLHGDTFRIHIDSENPQAAFTVLEYFFDEASLDLLNVYGGMPARPDIRDAYFAGLDEQFPQGVNWDVIIAGLDYSDVPNHQTSMPNFLESDARVKELEVPLLTDPDLDIGAVVTALEEDLTVIWAS